MEIEGKQLRRYFAKCVATATNPESIQFTLKVKDDSVIFNYCIGLNTEFKVCCIIKSEWSEYIKEFSKSLNSG